MKRSKDIFNKSVSLFFIGIVLLISLHNLIEHHDGLSNGQNHYCVLCHQVMIEPSPALEMAELQIILQSKIISRTNIFFKKETRFEHLFVRGPPIRLFLKNNSTNHN